MFLLHFFFFLVRKTHIFEYSLCPHTFFGFRLNLCHLQILKHPFESRTKDQPCKVKPGSVVEPVKEEQQAGWPSFGRLVIDLTKLAFEALASIIMSFIPFRFNHKGSKDNLTPLKASLMMPEDEAEAPSVQKQRTPAPLSETRQSHAPLTADAYSEMKPPKLRSASFKDPSLSSKHRSSKRQDYAELYASGEVPHRSKSQKERTKHRLRDKSGEAVFRSGEAVFRAEQRPAEMKAANYNDPKFDHYNMRRQYSESCRFE